MKNKSTSIPVQLRIAVFVLLCGMVQASMAQKITIDEARHIARNFMYEKGRLPQNNFKAASEQHYVEEGEEYLYTFDLEGDRGFVIVSADKIAKPIVAYSLHSKLADDNHSPAFEAWMQSYADQLEWAKSNGSSQAEKISTVWDKYQMSHIEFNASIQNPPGDALLDITGENTPLGIVGPLFGPDGDPNSISYGQSGYYNDACPGGSLVGCIGTAMSMIMVYYDHPNVGLGYREYQHSMYGMLSADFGGTIYNTAGLPSNIDAANAAVAQLSYHAGVSVVMNYGPSGSSSSTLDVETALITNWDYERNMGFRYRSGDDSAWESMIRADIDNGMPVLYRGSDTGGAGGHAWICDGYDESNNTYHMNWGWGGYDNGFFTLSILDGGGYDFSDSQGAIFGIKPNASDAKTVLREHFDVGAMYFYISPGWNMDGDGDGSSYGGYAGGRNGSVAKTGNGGKTDQWMISPKIGLPASSEINLSFYAHRQNDLNQKIEVYISTTGTEVATDYTLVESFSITDNWAEYTADLSAYAGQKIYVGIKSTGANSGFSYCFIDDLFITATVVEIATAPTVSTDSIGNVGFTGANAYGNVIALGSANPTAHGFCWSTSPGPTTADTNINLGAAASTGLFSSSIAALSEDTEYFVRAYATNGAGTAYGEERSFTTMAHTQTVYYDSLYICDGDSAFLEGIWRHLSGVYTDTYPDVLGNDSIVSTTLIVVPVHQVTRSISICSGESITFPDGTTASNIQANTSQISTLSSQTTGCDSIVTTNVTIFEPVSTTADIELCKGEDYTWPDGTTTSNIQANMSQISYLSSQVTGCDSIVTTNLTVTDALSSVVEVELCKGEDYTWPDGTMASNIQTNTNQTSYLSSQVTGCDSIVTTNITIIEPALTTVEVELCKGEDYTWPDGTSTNNIQANMSQISQLSSQVTGCDSIVTTNITIIEPVSTTAEVELCKGEDYTWPDGTTASNIQANRSQTSYLSSQVTGCDSIVTTNVTVTDELSTVVEVELCRGEDYTWPDGTTAGNIQANTSQSSYLTSQSTGCDSVVTTNVTIIESVSTTIAVELCMGEDYTWPDGTMTSNIQSNTSYTSYLTSLSTGCVRTITTNITIIEPYSTINEVSLCYGEPFTFPDGTTEFITANTSHVSHLNSVATGCDSTVTTNITINKIYAISEEAGICFGDDYTFPDGTTATNITKSINHVSDLVSTVTGCDSVVTTFVRVHTADAFITIEGNLLMADAVHADGFQWIDCDTNVPIPGATGSVFEAPNSGNYALIVENGGCRATTACIPFVITGLEDQEQMVHNIWPNPTSGVINVSLTKDLGLVDISIWDHLGKILVQNQIDLLSPVLSVHIPGGSGVYYVRVQSKSRTNTYKVIKK